MCGEGCATDPTRKGDGPKGWATAFDPRADYGVRVCLLALDQVGGPAGDDGGRLRATMTWLLLQRGLPKGSAGELGALAEGQKVEGIRKSDPYTQANLARVYAVNGLRKEAAERFVQAVQVGFVDFKTVAADPDFAAVRSNTENKELVWTHYAKPNLTVVVSQTADKGVSKWSAQVTNDGKLPLVNADLICGSDPKTAITVRVPYLAPGKTIPWLNICPVVKQGFKDQPIPLLQVKNDGQPDYRLPKFTYSPLTPKSWWGW